MKLMEILKKPTKSNCFKINYLLNFSEIDDLIKEGNEFFKEENYDKACDKFGEAAEEA